MAVIAPHLQEQVPVQLRLDDLLETARPDPGARRHALALAERRDALELEIERIHDHEATPVRWLRQELTARGLRSPEHARTLERDAGMAPERLSRFLGERLESTGHDRPSAYRTWRSRRAVLAAAAAWFPDLAPWAVLRSCWTAQWAWAPPPELRRAVAAVPDLLADPVRLSWRTWPKGARFDDLRELAAAPRIRAAPHDVWWTAQLLRHRRGLPWIPSASDRRLQTLVDLHARARRALAAHRPAVTGARERLDARVPPGIVATVDQDLELGVLRISAHAETGRRLTDAIPLGDGLPAAEALLADWAAQIAAG